MEKIRKIYRKLTERDRYEVFSALLLLSFLVLAGRLFYLTGIKGAYFREISQNKRAKDIVITAPRGEIRDRKGLLIAGNQPVFTVQLRKDELDNLKQKEKNESFLKLVRYLEEDGAMYTDDFPILLNALRYRNQRAYLHGEGSPEDMVVEEVIKGNFIEPLMELYYEEPAATEPYVFYMAKHMIHVVGGSRSIPIQVKRGEHGMEFSFYGGDEPGYWKAEQNFPENITAKDALLRLFSAHPETYFRKILEHPVARKLTYDFLKERGLLEDITLVPFFNRNYGKYFDTKIRWMEEFPSIRMESSAEEDFYTIFSHFSLESLLQKPVDETDEDVVFPGALLADLVSTENRKVTATLNQGKPRYRFKDGSDALAYLVRRGKEPDVLKKWLATPEMKAKAQKAMIDDGINSGISVANNQFQYVELKNEKDWKKSMKVEEGSTEREAFYEIKKRREIPDNVGVYETQRVLNIYHELNKQGNLAYIPIHLAYRIKESTVAKISENIDPNTGITVAREPIRQYPLGDSCAHILGYIGKISSEGEVSEYIDKRKYERNALIGKTGIEERYEDYLHGTNGSRRVEVDSVGNTTKILSETPSKAGNNIYLSIDLELQRKAEGALEKTLSLIREGGVYESPWGNFPMAASQDKGRPFIHAKSGAVMAVDVHTGKILCMASFPGYDPNLFSTGISSSDWESLIPKEEKDPLAPRPLYNIPLQTAVQPGSVFKMITGLTALEKGLDPNYKITDGGWVDVGGTVFGNWLWNQKREFQGDEDIYGAIRDSCNYYFYSLALGRDQQKDITLPVQITAEEIAETARKFGLGQSTGVEIQTPAEAKGNLPDPKSKTETMKSLLRHFFNAHLSEYYTGKEELTQQKSSQIIESVVSLMDMGELPNRKVVFDKLSSQQLDGEKKVPGRGVPLGDYILYDYINQSRWTMADTLNVTIGQGANSYTLAQVTRYVAALANGGTLYPLSFLEDIKDENNNNIILKKEVKGEKIPLKDRSHLEDVKKGMFMASTTGANKAAYQNFPIEVGVKTGTAQRAGINPYTKDTYDSFSWQVAFAPYDKPDIAVACVLVQGGPGSNGGPLIREVMAEYFGLNKEIKRDALPIETKVTP